MLGMSYYNQKDYQTAAQTFITYSIHILVVLLLNWHVSMQVRLYSWILRNHVWTQVKHLSGYPAIADVHGVFPEQHKEAGSTGYDFCFAG